MATRGDLKDRVQSDLDLEDEDFITDTDLNNFYAEGLRRAATVLRDLYEDYFKRTWSVPMVLGAQAITLPTDIFAHKIRTLVFDDGSDIYEMDRITSRRDKQLVEDDDDYQYDVEAQAGGTYAKLMLYPAARVTSSSIMIGEYIRDVKIPSADNEEMDVPEAEDYIVAHMKVCCIRAERSPFLIDAMNDRKDAAEKFLLTMKDRIPNEQNRIPMDLDHYMESLA